MLNNPTETIAPVGGNFEKESVEITEREKALKKYEENLFEKTWPAAFSNETPDFSETTTNEERAQVLWENLVPEFDEHINKWGIPTQRNPEESDNDFFTRIVGKMASLNEAAEEKDQSGLYFLGAFPKTAQEIGGLNCSLGSLVLARALERSGEDINEIEMGFPGPLTHAAIIHKGYYLDQANNVVEPIQKAEIIDGIHTHVLDLPKNHEIPFTRVPTTTPQKGIARVVSNLDALVSQANNGTEKPQQMVKSFKLPSKMEERGGDPWGREYLIGNNWTEKSFMDHPEWQEEKKESEIRFSLTPAE